MSRQSRHHDRAGAKPAVVPPCGLRQTVLGVVLECLWVRDDHQRFEGLREENEAKKEASHGGE